MFAIIGASRTGKTTLAKELAATCRLPFVDMSGNTLAEAAGLDRNTPVQLLTMEQRIDVQYRLLDAWSRLSVKAPSAFVTDRSPIDMVGYMLAEVSMHSNPEFGEKIADYVELCIEVTNRRLSDLIVVRPLPSYEVADGKPPLNRAYQMHVQAIIEGTAVRASDGSTRVTFLADLDLENRVQFGLGSIQERFKRLADDRGGALLH